MISIPGDNDIGGEGSDRITKAKAERFNSHFGSETRILNKYVDYLKVKLIGTFTAFMSILIFIFRCLGRSSNSKFKFPKHNF